MTYYGGKDLAAAFRTVRRNTMQTAEEIPEEQYGFRPSPQSRSIAQTLTHIALGPTFQMEVHVKKIDDLTKVDFPGLTRRLQGEEEKARSKAEILALLSSEGDKYASYLEGLSEAFLAEPVRMPPGAVPATKSRFEMLLSPKEHEMHHRGQLMLVQRMLGLVPHLTRQRQERMAAAAAKGRGGN
jgi:uncharacterized damage-inducible protein DinB